MSEPKSLDVIIATSLARMREFQETEEGRAHVERATAMAEERRRRDLRELAELRGVVADGDVRAYAFDPHLDGHFPSALRKAAAWRRERAQQTRERAPVVVWLASPPGLGKTVALCHAVVHAARSAWYVTATEISTMVRNGHSDPAAVWRRWERADVLAIDESGLEDKPDAITALVLARWSNAGATYIGTNLSRKDVAARHFTGPLGERLADRLVHVQQRHGQDWCVGATGKSLRAVAP